LYFFAASAGNETGSGRTVTEGVVDGRIEADGVVGVGEGALEARAGGAASSVVQPTAAVVTNATAPTHATHRLMAPSLPPYPAEPVERSGNESVRPLDDQDGGQHERTAEPLDRGQFLA
jgi:hypothetical protein